jgi:hypothetical protein
MGSMEPMESDDTRVQASDIEAGALDKASSHRRSKISGKLTSTIPERSGANIRASSHRCSKLSGKNICSSPSCPGVGSGQSLTSLIRRPLRDRRSENIVRVVVGLVGIGGASRTAMSCAFGADASALGRERQRSMMCRSFDCV